MKDLDKLIEISRETFIHAFEAQNDPEDFNKYLAKAFNKRTMQDELENPNAMFYFIIQRDFGLVGYVKLNRKDAQNETFDSNAIELQRIYIVKEFQGKRLGRKALNMVIDIAKVYKASCLWLGVWERNTRAISFYQSNGFVKFGEHPYLIGEDEQYDWMMKLELPKRI